VLTPTFFSAAAAGFDTVLYLRSDCFDAESEVDCNDDGDDAPGSTLDERLLAPGTYFLVVDGFSSRSFGDFTLDVTRRPDCPAGAATTCGDPGPSGRCPGTVYTCDAGNYTPGEACSFGCEAGACLPPANAGTCADPMPLPFVPELTIQDDTRRGAPLNRGGCGGGGAQDLVYRLDVPVLSFVDIQTTGFDTVLYGRTDCADPATQNSCNNDSDPPGAPGSRYFRRLAAGTYYIIVDGRSGAAGPFTLTMRTYP
jgi:hypothetical protein